MRSGLVFIPKIILSAILIYAFIFGGAGVVSGENMKQIGSGIPHNNSTIVDSNSNFGDSNSDPGRTQQESITGISIPIAEQSQQNLKEQFRGSEWIDSPHLFFLVNEGGVNLVVTQRDPILGQATVRGSNFGEVQIDGRSFYSSLSVSIVRARSISFSTQGEYVEFDDLITNPQEYDLELVSTRANHTEVSVRYDPDLNENYNRVFSPGTISDTLPTSLPPYSISELRSDSFELSDVSMNGSDSLVSTWYGTGYESREIETFRSDSVFWGWKNHNVNGVFVADRDYDSQLTKVFELAYPSGQFDPADHSMLITESDSETTVESDITEINNDIDSFYGKAVSVRGYFAGTKVSVQETIEHTSPCGEERAQEPSSGSCVNIPVDTVVYAGILYSTSSPSQNQIIPVIGFSGEHQDVAQEPITGRYQLTGRVANATWLLDRDVDRPLIYINSLEQLSGTSPDRTQTVSRSSSIVTSFVRSGLLHEEPERDADVLKTATPTRGNTNEQDQRESRVTTTIQESDDSGIGGIFSKGWFILVCVVILFTAYSSSAYYLAKKEDNIDREYRLGWILDSRSPMFTLIWATLIPLVVFAIPFWVYGSYLLGLFFFLSLSTAFVVGARFFFSYTGTNSESEQRHEQNPNQDSTVGSGVTYLALSCQNCNHFWTREISGSGRFRQADTGVVIEDPDIGTNIITCPNCSSVKWINIEDTASEGR